MLPEITYVRDGTHNRLMIGGVDAHHLAREYGTPLYVYARDAFINNYRQLATCFPSSKICYALKACGSLQVLRELVDAGAGLDVVSGGELERAWLSGVNMSDVVFAGVGKTEKEIAAALDGKYCLLGNDIRGRYGQPAVHRGSVGLFNIESLEEAHRINRIAADIGVTATACLRINPDVDARTHKYTTTGKHENKFGVDIHHAPQVCGEIAAMSHVTLAGLHMHLGSPIASPTPYIQAVEVVSSLLAKLNSLGLCMSLLNIGGGFGIDYGWGEPPSSLAEFAADLSGPLDDICREHSLRTIIEPGRCIIAQSGVLLTTVQYIKQARTKRFIICDAGMHTLLRPALYDAKHAVWPASSLVNSSGSEHSLQIRSLRDITSPAIPDLLKMSDVVGPICESSDFLAQSRPLPGEIVGGDLLAVFSAGAYGMSMALNYNDNPRPAEVMAAGGQHTLIRPHQSRTELVASELLCLS